MTKHTMRDVKNQYEGANFAAEKTVAMLYLALFVLILGMGVQAPLTSIVSDAASPAIEAALK